MKMALDQLAEFKDDPSISERDPLSPLSFCFATDEVRKSQEELYQIYLEGQKQALSPLAPDGRPLRKYVFFPHTGPRVPVPSSGVPRRPHAPFGKRGKDLGC